MPIAIRPAIRADIPRLCVIMEAAIVQLQQAFLETDQIASSRAVMGLDRQLVDDGTYFVAITGGPAGGPAGGEGEIMGCGGWSRRATLYGGDHSTALREPRLLDPAHEAARVRAMYTAPTFARSGVGRAILAHCEAAARAEGFKECELMSTRAGEPLYTAAGYEVMERIEDSTGGVAVPLARMRKLLS